MKMWLGHCCSNLVWVIDDCQKFSNTIGFHVKVPFNSAIDLIVNGHVVNIMIN